MDAWPTAGLAAAGGLGPSVAGEPRAGGSVDLASWPALRAFRSAPAPPRPARADWPAVAASVAVAAAIAAGAWACGMGQALAAAWR